MRIVPAIEQEIRRAIRDEKALDPLITVLQLQKALEKRFGRTFDWSYLRRLHGKVERQALIDIDRAQIEQRLNFTRENYRMMREELLKIVYWSQETAQEGERRPITRDRIEAAKNVVMMDLALLNAELANGLYKKPIDVIANSIHYEPLPGEVRTVVIQSWRNFGLLTSEAIDKMVPLLQHADPGAPTA